ncbi:organic cation transporter protein-like [Asterias rubens]|uniref:organic cation transporter protein-like n=1 Tax=Asterias rubens TaxID=7604 RepID=UPI001455262D|nr:organic cation transporter protein-like [Asterias rubens]
MDVDEAFRYLGNFGRYQTLVFVVVSIMGTWFPAWQMMAMVFTTDEPFGYQCKSPGAPANGSLVSYSANFSETGSDNKTAVEECYVVNDEMVNNGSLVSNQTACTEWTYLMKYGETTAVSDLNLICGRDLLPKTAQSIFMAGVLVGSLLAGTLSDMFGRKTVLTAASLLEGIFGFGLAFVWTYTGFVGMWFFVGMFEQGLNIIQFVLIIETFSPEKRTFAGCINGVFWGIGVTLLTPIAYFFRNWRHMQIAISLPSLVVVPLLWWVSFESVRWLVSKDRVESAEKILHRIARLNKLEAPDKFLKKDDSSKPMFALTAQSHSTDDNKNDTSQNGDRNTNEVKIVTGERPLPPGRGFRLADLRDTPLTVRNTFVMLFSWMVSSMVYYGMSLNSSNLAGDKYLNFFLLGLVEIPGYVVSYFMLEWWGRRPSLSLAHFIAGVSGVLCACIPVTTAGGFDMTAVITTFALIGKLGVTISFGVDFVYGAEIFPTTIRNGAFGFCSFAARIGGILAPFVLYLKDVSPFIPLNIFGALSLIAAVIVLVLPETHKRALPETLTDGEELARSARPPSCPKCFYFRRRRMSDTEWEAAE